MTKKVPYIPPPERAVLGHCNNCEEPLRDGDLVWNLLDGRYLCTGKTCHERFEAEKRGCLDVMGFDLPEGSLSP